MQTHRVRESSSMASRAMRTIIAAAIALLALAAGRAQADLVPYDFTGTVFNVFDFPGSPLGLAAAIPTGTAVTGRFGYDPDTPASSAIPTRARSIPARRPSSRSTSAEGC